MDSTVPFYRHDLGEAEVQMVREVLTGTILTTGDYVRRFEEGFASYLNRRHAIACTSWTGAAHISLLGLGIQPGDEVITTPLTFIASATAIIQARAVPVFVDVEPATGNLNADLIHAAITPRTRAIMPVHLYGLMCDMRGLRRIANEHGLKIIEDAAHCVEGVRDGIRPGELSEAVCFSFFATKNLACGEGGAAVCDNEPLAESLRLLRLHGMNKTSADREREGYQHWDMPSFGWKYNMDNIHAAMLLPQIPLIERRWQMRQTVAEWYFDEFENLKEVSWPSRLPGCKHANHLFTIWVDPERRDALIAHLKCRGISSVVNYRPIHLLTYFKDSLATRQGMFPNAERIGASTISLPFFVSITREQVARVAREIRAFFRNRQPAS